MILLLCAYRNCEIVGVIFMSTYRERYNHRRRLGYSPEKARRMAKSGCYVATAVYGSYDCPEVWTLRRYRDYKLRKSIFGRFFIRAYYVVSPVLVKFFGDTKWFKGMLKPCLDKLVNNLREQGFEDTPYKD